MDITIYDIIKGPIITSKAYRMNNDLNQLVVSVHMKANKPLVKEALEKLFSVKVKTVRISIRKPKNKMANRRAIKGVHSKRAIVTLKEGYSIDVLGQTGTDVAAADHVQKQSQDQG